MIPKLTDDERLAFVANARALLGVPFKPRGRSARSLDCAGLPALALAQLGHVIDDLRVYGRNPHMDGLQAMVEANLGPPVEGPPQFGDVLLMAWDDAPPRHIAIVTDHPFGLGIIHTCSAFQRVIEHALDDTWRARIRLVYRP